MERNFTNPNPPRYNIILRLAAFDKAMQMKIKKRVQKKMRVSDSTMHRWIHCRQDDSLDIPGKALLHFAISLNTTMEELFNDQSNN